MKAFSTARTAIMELFETSRAASANYPTDAEFPIAIRNRRFKRPDDKPWGRLTLITGDRTAISVGGRRGAGNLARTPFILALQIFVPENQGEKVAHEIAEEILSGMEFATDVRLDGAGNKVHVVCETPNFAAVGKASADEDPGAAGFEQFNATVNGRFDDVVSSVTSAADLGLDVFLKKGTGITESSPGVVSAWADQSGNGNDFSLSTGDLIANTPAGLVFGANATLEASLVFNDPFILAMQVQDVDGSGGNNAFFAPGSGEGYLGFDESSGEAFMQEALLGTKIVDTWPGGMTWIVAKFAGSQSELLIEGGTAVAGSLASVDLTAPVSKIGSVGPFLDPAPSVIVANLALWAGGIEVQNADLQDFLDDLKELAG